MATKAKGLGDVISVVTKAIGIEECEGCKKRKDYLNINFAFNKPKPLSKIQRQALEEEGTKIIIDGTEVDVIPDYLSIYNDCFNQEVQPEQFTGGVKKAILKKLKQLQDYEN